jgi:hypothetical protein
VTCVFLSVFYKDEWRSGVGPEATARLISDVLTGLDSDEDAWFCLADRPTTDDDAAPSSNLRVAVGEGHEYGALIWFPDDDFPRKGGVYDSVWISDNPAPAADGPRVVADPGYPLFHDPASVLPVSQVRAAVEEFCRAGTGDRPGGVAWVAGHMNGQRLDRPPIVEEVEDPEIDWESLR